jgi:adenine deaminase
MVHLQDCPSASRLKPLSSLTPVQKGWDKPWLSGKGGADLKLGWPNYKVLVEVARGRRSPDLLLKNARVVDLWTRQIRPASVGVVEGWIAYVGPDSPGWKEPAQIVDLEGQYVVPGYLEPHCHPDFMYSPLSLALQVLPRGTTGLFCDTLFLVNVMGPSGVQHALDLAQTAPIRFWWAAPSSPRTRLPDGEPDILWWSAVEQLLGREDTAVLAEVTRWLDAIEGDTFLVGRVQQARNLGLRVDGHSAGAKGTKAAAYAASGITADHEPIEAGELLEKLELGLWCMLRHSSLRPDLPALAQLLIERPWLVDRVMLTTDGPSPDFLCEVGHLDALVRMLIDLGIDPLDVYRMASLNVALYYRIEDRIGLVAPGRAADLLIMEDLRTGMPSMVMVNGDWVSADGVYVGGALPTEAFSGLPHLCSPDGLPSVEDVFGRLRQALPPVVPVLRFESAVITRLDQAYTEDAFGLSLLPDEDLSMGWLLARDGSRVTPGFIRGLGKGIQGLATTLNTACEYLVLGKDLAAMQWALDRVIGLGGGIVAVGRGGLAAQVPLPIGGRMSKEPVEQVARDYRQLKKLLKHLGYPFHDPAYSLHFLSGDLLPEVRLTPVGVWDVRHRKVLLESVPLDG